MRIITNKRGLAHISLASIHPTYKRGVARISFVCHAPFISDYSRMSKFLLASTRDVALERYHICYAILFTRFMTLPSPELEEVEIYLRPLDLMAQ